MRCVSLTLSICTAAIATTPLCICGTTTMCKRLVTNLFKATTPKGSTVARPVLGYGGEYAASGVGVLSQIRSSARRSRTSRWLWSCLRAGEVREDDDSYVSPLDELFDRLETVNPEHIALKYYRDYHSGSAKDLKEYSNHACRKA